MTSEEYEKWANENGIFISKVIKRLVFGRSGVYILNAINLIGFLDFMVRLENIGLNVDLVGLDIW